MNLSDRLWFIRMDSCIIKMLMEPSVIYIQVILKKKQFCTDRPPIVGLAHELGHAFYFNNGTVPIQRNADGIDEINKSAFENLAIVKENIARKAYGLKERPLMK